MPHKEKKIRDGIKASEFSHVLMLSHATLISFPMQIFNQENELLTKLLRLDLSFNCIQEIPHEISLLLNLKEIWISNNPLLELPSSIGNLKKLEVLDISNTKVSDLPPEIGLNVNLYELDWRNTPLSKFYNDTYNIVTNDLSAVKVLLISFKTRKNLEEQLYEMLSGTHFQFEADKPNILELIANLVKTISGLFTDLNEMKMFVRIADTLLPQKTDLITPESLKLTISKFYNFQKETHRKRMAADVEIKLRGIYFDRIERSLVMDVIDSIYDKVKTLEDIQFLCKYASQIFPPTPEECTGELVWDNILVLQSSLIAKREGAVKALAAAMQGLYPEQKPEIILLKAKEIGKKFEVERFATKRELNTMSQIIAESGKLFPTDFVSCEADEISHQVHALFSRAKTS